MWNCQEITAHVIWTVVYKYLCIELLFPSGLVLLDTNSVPWGEMKKKKKKKKTVGEIFKCCAYCLSILCGLLSKVSREEEEKGRPFVSQLTHTNG